METSSNHLGMGAIMKYLKERFPLGLAGLFALAYGALGIGLIAGPAVWLTETGAIIRIWILLSGVFFLFLFRQRITDEFKDETYDQVNFPHRPLQRGLITKNQLTFMLAGVLALELLLITMLGRSAILGYLPVLIYSFLMGKEFFVSAWLTRRFSVYFWSHEVIFIFYGIFFLLTLRPDGLFLLTQNLISIAVLFLVPVGAELIRKFSPRYDPRGNKLLDSYVAVWGYKFTLSLLIGLCLGACTLLTLSRHSIWFIVLGLLISAVWLYAAKRSDKLVVLVGAVYLLAIAVLVNII